MLFRFVIGIYNLFAHLDSVSTNKFYNQNSVLLRDILIYLSQQKRERKW